MRETLTKALVVVVGAVVLSCGGAASLPEDNTDRSVLLPDLRIKRIEYRKQNKQLLNPMRSMTNISPAVVGMDYEFRLHFENVGERAFEEPFYLSVSGSLNEYQDYQYSRHLLLNNERQSIEPGQVVYFAVPLRLDFPPRLERISHYPVRFYINTEGINNSTGFPTLYREERSYRNNFYELQIRL
ncbi:MAG: hypothetical protein ACRDGA_08695 [Bacteroidota bacterium]